MARRPSGRPAGRPPTVASATALVTSRQQAILDQIKLVAQNLPLPPVPTEPEHLPVWLQSVTEFLRSTTELQYRVGIARMAETDPDGFMKAVSRNADIHMPKLGRVDAKVSANVDVRTFVQVERREEPPTDFVQQEDGSWAPRGQD